MGEIIRSGRAIDWILVLIAFEALAVLGCRAITGRGPMAVAFIGNILAGSFLLVALRGALTGASWIWIALSLIGAFAAHLADLAGRWEVSACGIREPSSRALLVAPRFRAEREPRRKRRVVRSRKAPHVAGRT